MTREEAFNLANSGNVTAMQSLGEYYLNNNHYPDAWKWFSKAADLGYTKSAVNASYVGEIYGVATLKGLGDICGAAEIFKKTLDYCYKAVASDDVPANIRQTLASHLPNLLFELGYCFYMQDEIDKAEYYLKQGAANDADCHVLLGLCIFMKEHRRILRQRLSKRYLYLKKRSRLR